MHGKVQMTLCVCLGGGAHSQVIGQRDQHAAVVHEAGELTAVVQLPVPGEEQRRLEAHGTCTHRHRALKSKASSGGIATGSYNETGQVFSQQHNKHYEK